MTTLIHWINDHKYSYAMLYMIFYLITFFTLEHVTTPKYIIHSRLDELIPFCEYMIIPYLSWLIIFPGSLFVFMLLDKEDFLNLCMLMFGGSIVCFLSYIIWPSGLDLRVEITGENMLTKFIMALWTIDTPTNVCPSLHVSTSTAIIAVMMKSSGLKSHPVIKYGCIVWLFIICISTAFVKQHSVIDIFFGALVSIVFYFITYHTDWRSIFRKTFLKIIID